MENKHFFILGAFLMIIAVSEPGVVPRSVPREASGNGEIPRKFNGFDKDMRWEPGHGIREDFHSKEFETGVIDPHRFPTDYDFGKSGEGDSGINEIKPEMEPERVLLDESKDDDKDVPKYEEDDKPEDEGFLETSDGEEDSDEFMDDNKDSASSADEDGKTNDQDEDDEKIPKENDDSPEGEPEENDGSPEGEPEENDDDNQEEDAVDKEDKDDKAIGGGWGSGLLNIFNTPSFNFDIIREYSSQLEKAFRQLFRQTADKALQMNGTFTNTTEEEVEIGGKKYIVHKSIIKGGDNESSIYIETLSRNNGSNDTEGIQANIIENIERQM